MKSNVPVEASNLILAILPMSVKQAYLSTYLQRILEPSLSSRSISNMTQNPVPSVESLPTIFPRLKIHDITEHVSQSGQKHILNTTYTTRQKAIQEASKRYPLTVIRFLDAGGQHTSTNLEIRSTNIVQALQNVFDGYEGLSLEGEPVVFSHPFCPFVHRFDEIWKYAHDGERSEEQRADLEHLLCFMCTELQDELREFREV